MRWNVPLPDNTNASRMGVPLGYYRVNPGDSLDRVRVDDLNNTYWQTHYSGAKKTDSIALALLYSN